MTKLDYDALGFRSGLEVHYQLLTARKLYCRCPAGRYSTDFDAEVLRHMRPTLSELGVYDRAALMEFKTRKEVVYQVRNDTVCTYEMDDTPPFPPDPRVIDIMLEVALLLRCSVVGEIHITRKQYLDGSIPTGFQRTAIVGVEGKIPLRDREVPVIQISFEEDSCREVADEGHRITFRTDRLGMPLLEVVTYPEMRTPDEVVDVGRRIGQLLRATGKVRRGIGSVRQDVNVSIEGAPRVEIKGVPQLSAFRQLTHNEALRQKGLLEIREELRKRGIGPDDVTAQPAPLPAEGIEDPILREACARGHQVWAIRVPRFVGILGWHLQDGPEDTSIPFLRDVAGRVRVIACLDQNPILFCRDAADPRRPEILSDRDWEAAARATGAKDEDALLVAFGPEGDLRTAVQEIEIRLREAAVEIPHETRQSLGDGTTDFERILAGSDRMYPDTDLPLIPIEEAHLARIEAAMPEPPWERETRYLSWKLPEDVVSTLAFSPRGALLDRIVAETGASPLLAGCTLVHTAKSIKKADLSAITDDGWVTLFQAFQDGKFGREAIPALLRKMAGGESLEAALGALNLSPLADEALEKLVAEVIAAHGADPMHNPADENRLAYLMGLVMKEVRGRRGGQEIGERVRQKWQTRQG
ncbi:MAG: Glu-tRNA(Gln) amidotransferase subunit GatE [bacterium]|nr:Glu-tRNA(Gln) amidotransferase subunit GatE [bacterium]